jgi:hypothetical protein
LREKNQVNNRRPCAASGCGASIDPSWSVLAQFHGRIAYSTMDFPENIA